MSDKKRFRDRALGEGYNLNMDPNRPFLKRFITENPTPDHPEGYKPPQGYARQIGAAIVGKSRAPETPAMYQQRIEEQKRQQQWEQQYQAEQDSYPSGPADAAPVSPFQTPTPSVRAAQPLHNESIPGTSQEPIQTNTGADPATGAPAPTAQYSNPSQPPIAGGNSQQQGYGPG